MTLMWARDCASALEVCGSIGRLLGRCCRQPQIARFEAAIFASDQVERSQKGIRASVERELEAARYEASLAARTNWWILKNAMSLASGGTLE
jgi:hypothetical protein